MNAETETLCRLITLTRWAALATLGTNGPLVSMVAYAVDREEGALLLHLSQLAQHTRNMLADPRVSLAISAPDDGRGDPQTLARVSLQGRALPLERAGSDHARARVCYQSRFPAAEQRFGFADFVLFRLQATEIRFVGGFAQTMTLPADACAQLLRQSGAGSR